MSYKIVIKKQLTVYQAIIGCVFRFVKSVEFLGTNRKKSGLKSVQVSENLFYYSNLSQIKSKNRLFDRGYVDLR